MTTYRMFPDSRRPAKAGLITLFALAGTAPIWAGDSVWCGPGVVPCLVLILFLFAIGQLQLRCGPVIFRRVPSIAAIGLLLLVSRASWLASQIVLARRSGLPVHFGLGVAVGIAVGTVAAALRSKPAVRWRCWIRNGALVALWMMTLVGIILYVSGTGPRDFSRYPISRNSPYRLPWPQGVPRLCVQGNRGIVSHRGWEEFAYDFAMPVGSEVCAARGGTVILVDVSHDGHGTAMPNNEIVVDHGDGTIGWYLHLEYHASRVQVGERVAQGQVIAASGNVGLSMLPHLHFQVTAGQTTVPITFADVPGDGIPRMFRRYSSGKSPQL